VIGADGTKGAKAEKFYVGGNGSTWATK